MSIKMDKSVGILGVFEGECADAAITNNNGLDITRPVWEHVFESEDYRVGIENGWFIGYPGHPEDPNYQEFDRACIVMTEGHIESDDKVKGKFNLLDTPVGRIIKSMIDAGVKFGISVRGAGDIIDNSVEPETFIFRGFDLVAFPAYPDAVPTFTEIAASTDLETQRRYKIMCSTLKTNLNKVTSVSALNEIQKSFAKQSPEYSEIEDRKAQIVSSAQIDISAQKVEAVTELYLEAKTELDSLRSEIQRVKAGSDRKTAALERIMSSQLTTLQSANVSLRNQYHTSIVANRKLRSELNDLSENNLSYRQRIEATTSDIRRKDSTISKLKAELSETVTAATASKQRSSNLDETVKNLRAKVEACERILSSYQSAFAELYASALGVNLNSHFAISADTSVDELRRQIDSSVQAATSTCNLGVAPQFVELVNEDDESELITL